MLKLLVDTNVFYDYFAMRHPFDRDVSLLLFGCAMQDYEVWISSSQVTDLYFLLTHGDRRIGKDDAVQTLRHLRRFVRVASMTEADVDDALDSGWGDCEDACVHSVARRLKANYVVTRNKKDFALSKVAVVSPGEFLTAFAETTGITYDNVDLS